MCPVIVTSNPRLVELGKFSQESDMGAGYWTRSSDKLMEKEEGAFLAKRVAFSKAWRTMPPPRNRLRFRNDKSPLSFPVICTWSEKAPSCDKVGRRRRRKVSLVLAACPSRPPSIHECLLSLSSFPGTVLALELEQKGWALQTWAVGFRIESLSRVNCTGQTRLKKKSSPAKWPLGGFWTSG